MLKKTISPSRAEVASLPSGESDDEEEDEDEGSSVDGSEAENSGSEEYSGEDDSGEESDEFEDQGSDSDDEEEMERQQAEAEVRLREREHDMFVSTHPPPLATIWFTSIDWPTFFTRLADWYVGLSNHAGPIFLFQKSWDKNTAAHGAMEQEQKRKLNQPITNSRKRTSTVVGVQQVWSVAVC